MRRFQKTKIALTALILCGFAGGTVCGHVWLPTRLLDNGGSAMRNAPEFYFEFEVKRIAKNFPTPFKAVRAEPESDQGEIDGGKNEGKAAPLAGRSKQTSDTDRADFDEALAKGSTKPADVEKAKTQHTAARDFIVKTNADDKSPLPEEFPGEFADYHRGAILFKQSKTDDARKAWEALLALPAEQRHYRSTWAAFMLGKLALDAKDFDTAKKWFAMTRDFAGKGFADSPGLAVASLGWEARAELDRNDLPGAARLYLQGTAGGDLTSVDSLLTVAQTALAGAEPLPNAGTEERAKLALEKANADNLQKAAADPVLRQIVSAYILTRVVPQSRYESDKSSEPALARNWLSTIEKIDVQRVESADLLGWIAYTIGDYDAAGHWLKHADPDSGMRLWLKAKLDFRAGKLADATAAMSNAVRKIPFIKELEMGWNENQLPSPPGDLAMLWLARGEFLNAFHFFLAGDYWEDAAYVAERVLTPTELIALVDKEFPASLDKPETKKSDEDGPWERLPTDKESLRSAMRWLLARRLTRLNRCAEARRYFPVEMRGKLDAYAAAIQQAGKTSIASARADALWQAAKIARADGMELIGTEVEPDAFTLEGEFPLTDVAGERSEEKYVAANYDIVEEKKGGTQPIVVPVSAAEKKRLAHKEVKPEKRFHYRYIAVDLAWRAAKLMPDNDEQTALVLNTAGSWLKDRDDKAADRFYQAIEKRCPATQLGREAVKRHWFVPEPEASPTPVQ